MVLNSRGELFESVEAAFEAAHLTCAIREAEGLRDVHILFDEEIHERGVDVKLTQFEVHGG
jgi:hypothetical protein